jgi:hypothetical protein
LDDGRVELEVDVFDPLQVDSAQVASVAGSVNQLLGIVQDLKLSKR